MLKLPAAHKTIKALVEAIRRFSVVCREHKYHTVFSHGTKQTGAFLDKWMQKKQFLLSFGEIWLWQRSIFIKRYMFYFHWQTIFQTVREKIKIYGDRRRRNTTRSIWPSLHMVTPISDLLSMQPLDNSFVALTPTCLSHCLIFHWFLPMFSLARGKMSCERQIPLLKHDVQPVMRYWGVDNSITIAAIQRGSWQDWWPHDRISPPVMTRLRYSWLMDTSPRPTEVIAENAQQATALFSCVNFAISACLTIPDQYSIKELFFCPQLICCFLGQKIRTENRQV